MHATIRNEGGATHHVAPPLFQKYSPTICREMKCDNHVLAYRAQEKRKMNRMQSNFNDKMLRTTYNQITRDKGVVMDFIKQERDEKKRDKLWDLYRHASLFVQFYDGCTVEDRKKPSYYRSCEVVWKKMRDQNEGGRKLFLIMTSSPCYGFDTSFFAYQITIKGVNGNSLELLDPYLEHLQARCLLGDINDDPIVPFSPLTDARLANILELSADPEPVTRDESLIGTNEGDLAEAESVSAPLEMPVRESAKTPIPAPVDDFDDTESNGWFDQEAARIISRNAEYSAKGNSEPIGFNINWYHIITVVISFIIGYFWAF